MSIHVVKREREQLLLEIASLRQTLAEIEEEFANENLKDEIRELNKTIKKKRDALEHIKWMKSTGA